MNRKSHMLVLIVLVLVTIGITTVDASSITDIFLPLVVKRTNSQTTSPSGVLYVFSTTATTNGNAGGRSGMNAVCSNEDQEAHFCSIHEIENAWTTTGVFYTESFNQAWVDEPSGLGTLALDSDGKPPMSAWSANGISNCSGWSKDIGSGMTIIDGAIDLSQETCDTYCPISCCKWSP